MQFDVVIVAAGPCGLCFAASSRNQPLRIALIDQLGADILRDPAYDGREIALTQRSVRCCVNSAAGPGFCGPLQGNRK
jgi:2-polyprenyl-6-methoxyphenol hydroxylase-like FAD-dependent oxidoreductase